MQREEFLSALGERLRRAREALSPRMSRSAVAEKVGCAPRTLQNWEEGEHAPPADTLRQMSDLYGVSCDYLVGLTPDHSREGRAIIDRRLMEQVEGIIDAGDEAEARKVMQWMPSIILLDVVIPGGAEVARSEDAEREVKELLHRFQAAFPKLAREWASSNRGEGNA